MMRNSKVKSNFNFHTENQWLGFHQGGAVVVVSSTLQ